MFDILRIQHCDSHFEQCYLLLQKIFSPDELVSYAEYEYLLSHPTWDHEFVLLARMSGDTLEGVVAGSYLSLPPDFIPDDAPYLTYAFGMIEYLAVAQPGGGHGSALLKAFETTMLMLADERNQRLCGVIGEVEEALLPFKFKTGYQLLEDVWYAQPPIAFDDRGRALHPVLPKLLMIKPFPDADCIDADLLHSIVAQIYRKRYVPLTDPVTMASIEDYIFKHIYSRFERSTQRRSIRLRKAMDE